MKQFLLFNILLTISLTGISQITAKSTKALGVTISLPWMNNYVYHDYETSNSSSKFGFVGIGGSVFYKIDKNKVSINIGLTGDLPVPIGPFDYEKQGTKTSIQSSFLEMLYHKYLFKRVKVIAGVNHLNYKFNFTNYEDSSLSYLIADRTIGATLGGEFYFSKNSSVALFYRPAIISSDLKQYRHLLSLDFRFDIPLWKSK